MKTMNDSDCQCAKKSPNAESFLWSVFGHFLRSRCHIRCLNPVSKGLNKITQSDKEVV